MTTMLHWWPDCPLWPMSEAEDRSGPDVVHVVAVTPAEVTCTYCRHDPSVRDAQQPRER